MPVQKRYFHCSQDLISDPEVWELIKEFGDRSILTWLQILIYLERTNNQWRMVGDWLAILSRSVRQSSANLSRQVGWMVAKGWLEVGEVSATGSPLLLRGSNWLKYNKTRETKKHLLNPDQEIKNENDVSPPFLSFPFHSFPKEKKEKSITSQALRKPSKRLILDDEWIAGLKADPVYDGIDIDLEFKKASAWYPSRGRKLSRQAFVNWLIREIGKKPMAIPTSLSEGSYHKKVQL